MPRPRFQRAAPEKRNAVLDAAMREFATHGYDGASVNRILVAAGLSKGAFYYYFDDKADLAAAVLERETSRVWAAMGEPRMPDTREEFWAEMDRNVDAGLAQMREAPQAADAIARLGTAAAKHPELMALLGPMIRDGRAKTDRLWRRGQEVGAVRTDVSLDALMATLVGMKMAASNALLPADRPPSAEELAAFTRFYTDLVRRVVEPRR